MVDAGKEGDQLTHMDRLLEQHTVNGERHDIMTGIAAGAGVGHFIKLFEDSAPMNLAAEVGHVRGH